MHRKLELSFCGLTVLVVAACASEQVDAPTVRPQETAPSLTTAGVDTTFSARVVVTTGVGSTIQYRDTFDLHRWKRGGACVLVQRKCDSGVIG